MTYSFTEGQLNSPPEPRLVAELSDVLGANIPNDYLDFLQQHNGGEGFVGDNYLVLWKTEELIDFNREYEVEKYAPGIFLFGSNGGGEGYGFDTNTVAKSIVRVPFIGMDRRYATPFAKDFPDFFAKLAAAQ